jgi:O-antigen/teichoic acid export membrane protein
MTAWYALSAMAPDSDRPRMVLLSTLRRWLSNERTAYVAVNVGVNLLFLVRSYVAMRVLDYAALGQLVLLQSVMLLVGTLQFGVINGGYRLLCDADDSNARRISNLVFSFVLVVSLGCAVVGAVLVAYSDSAAVGLMLALGMVAGLLSLMRNWISNMMTARVALTQLNCASLMAAVASMLMLLAVPLAPLAACVASVLVQPAAFVLLTLLADRRWRPSRLSLPPALLRQVLTSGFIVFLTGLLVQVNAQLERWYVADHIGLEALGHLYLAILFVSLFQLVPTSLDALFLPRLVVAHGAEDVYRLRLELRRFLCLLAGYSLIATAAVLLLAAPLLSLLLPKYVPDLHYVNLLLPGLVLLTLTNPFAVVGNVLIRYRTYLVAYGGGTLLTAAVFSLGLASGRTLDLEQVSLLRSATYALIGLLLLAGFVIMSREHRQFRFRPWPLAMRGPA